MFTQCRHLCFRLASISPISKLRVPLPPTDIEVAKRVIYMEGMETIEMKLLTCEENGASSLVETRVDLTSLHFESGPDMDEGDLRKTVVDLRRLQCTHRLCALILPLMLGTRWSRGYRVPAFAKHVGAISILSHWPFLQPFRLRFLVR